MYPNISTCPSLLLLKTAATFASLKLSLLTRSGNRSKDPDRRGVVRTEFANVLKLDFTAHSGVHSILILSFYVPVSVSFCVHVMSVPTFNRSEAQAICLALVTSQDNPRKTV